MSKLHNDRTSVATLMGFPVVDDTGKPLGRVCEFAVAPTVDPCHVEALVLGSGSLLRIAGRKPRRSLLPVHEVASSEDGTIRAKPGSVPINLLSDESYLLLERDLLDQQIIDVHGHKVVRVNDVEMVWERTDDDRLSLRIAEVEVGSRGALRRLLKGLLPAKTVEKLAVRLRTSVIPWDFVDLIDRDPARRVRLKIEQDRLSRMHPSDLADILEELAPVERQALFSSLDEEVAAEALEEVEPKLQKTLIEALDSERVAGILEEMDPGAAADLLSELSDERSDAILEEMDPEERQEVEELLEFSPDSAAGLMTSEFLALPPQTLVAAARQELERFEGDPEAITDVFLIDEDGKLHGRVPLIALMLASVDIPLDQLTAEHMVSAKQNANGRKVAELFDKYNLRSLPVVDQAGVLAGIVRADQVIAWLRSRN